MRRMWQLHIRFYLIAIVWLSDVFNPGLTGIGFVRAKPNPNLPKKQQMLYSVHDDVIILDHENFRDRVYGKSMVWMIEFYNSWCGHCIKYAPTWKKFASDLKGWRRVVSVGAVDCSDKEQLEICQEYGIEGFPTIKLFPAGFNPDTDKGKTVQLQTNDPTLMKEVIVEYLVHAPFTPPALWPRLSPLTSLGNIWDEAKEEHKFVVVVFEEEDSMVGREVILDVVDFPSLLVRRMLRKDLEKFGSFTYPSLYSINKDSSFQLLARGGGLANKDRHAFVDKLMTMLHLMDSDGNPIHIGHRHDTDSNTDVEDSNEGNVVHFEQNRQEQEEEQEEEETEPRAPTAAAATSARFKGVHLQDLQSALYYSFHQEVAISKTIEGPRLDALRNFVIVLAKYFPGGPQVSAFLWNLADHLRRQDTSLTGHRWLKTIDELQDKESVLPEEIRWVGCQGSQPGFRGYPCSMWTLFHTLTVGAYEHTGTAVNAQEVLLAVRAYMEHFFGCQECAMHFGKMAADLERHVHRPLDAVLWLWNAHNSANRRLHSDISEDPRHPKIQFPSAADCPRCRSVFNSSSDPYPGWNVSAVALYLIGFYGKDAIIQDSAVEGGVLEVKEKGSEPKEMDWWEKKQRQDDLRRLQQLRQQKRKEKLRKVLGDAELKRVSGSPQRHHEHRAGRPGQALDILGESFKMRRLGEGWGLNQIDVGVCLVFYLSCALIILVLYYHFVVHRRFRLPCKGLLPAV